MEYVTLGKSDLKVSLAWLLTKVASPVVGVTKIIFTFYTLGVIGYEHYSKYIL